MDGIRVQIGGSEAPTHNTQYSNNTQVRTGENKHMSVSIGGGEVTSHSGGVQQATSSPIKEDFHPFASINNPQGDRIGGDMTKVNDNCSMAFGSERARMSVGAAIQQGLLARAGDGTLELTESGKAIVDGELGKRIERLENDINQAEKAPLPVSQQVMQDAAQLTQRGGPGVQASLADGIVAMINNDPKAYQKAIFEISQAAGASGVDGFMAAYGEQASQSLTNDLGKMMNTAPEDVYDFAVETIPARELAQIITAHAQGDRTVTQAVREKYGPRFTSWLRRQEQ